MQGCSTIWSSRQNQHTLYHDTPSDKTVQVLINRAIQYWLTESHLVCRRPRYVMNSSNRLFYLWKWCEAIGSSVARSHTLRLSQWQEHCQARTARRKVRDWAVFVLSLPSLIRFAIMAIAWEISSSAVLFKVIVASETRAYRSICWSVISSELDNKIVRLSSG